MVLYFILLPAMFFDVRSFRIPNALIVMGWISGFIYRIYSPGAHHIFYYLLSSCAMIIVLIPFFKMRAIGGGDVKLLSVCAMFAGLERCLNVSVYALFFAGIYSLFYLVFHRIFSKRKQKTQIIHFSIPIFLGTITEQIWGGSIWQIF